MHMYKYVSSIVCSVAFLLLPALAEATSQGPLSAGAGADDNSYGVNAWGSPGNITASDGSVTTAFTNIDTTHYLVATNFGFTVPSGNTIDGVKFESQNGEMCAASYEDRIRLVKGGTIGSTDRSTGAFWSQGGGYATYGSASDLWGTTLTYTDVNATNFGIALAAFGAGLSCITVDHVRATVYYTAGGGPVPEFSTWALLLLLGAGAVLLKKEGFFEKATVRL